jgi:hypothetical protein
VVGYLVDGWHVLEAMNAAVTGSGVGLTGKKSAGAGRFPVGEDWRVSACGQLSRDQVHALLAERAAGGHGKGATRGTPREEAELAGFVAAVAKAAAEAHGKPPAKA